MKIVFLQDDFPPMAFGGAGISTFEVAQATKRAGHEVAVITTCRKNAEAGEFEYEGLKVFRIESEYPSRWRWYVSIYNRRTIPTVTEILKSFRPDVVNVNNVHEHLSYHCLKIANKYSKVVVFTARDVMTFNYAKLDTKSYLDNFEARTTWRDHIKQAGKRWNPLRNILIRKYLMYADRVVAISGALKTALEQNGIGNVEVIHNGIDLSEWEVSHEETARFRDRYALTDKRVILFSGRLSAAKGGEKVIEALASIASEMSNVVLLVAGTLDWYAEVMKKKAQKLGVEERLVFTGWLDRQEIKLSYKVAHVVLMPSICFDAFGRVNLEAMASKKPVVGTCYGGTPEVVQDSVTGYIVNPLHADQISDKTLELLRNEEKAQQCGKPGYERARAMFNLKDKVLAYERVYKEYINQ